MNREFFPALFGGAPTFIQWHVTGVWRRLARGWFCVCRRLAGWWAWVCRCVVCRTLAASLIRCVLREETLSTCSLHTEAELREFEMCHLTLRNGVQMQSGRGIKEHEKRPSIEYSAVDEMRQRDELTQLWHECCLGNGRRMRITFHGWDSNKKWLVALIPPCNQFHKSNAHGV